MADPFTVNDLASLIAARRPAGGVMLVGVTGSVAVGKSTLVTALAQDLAGRGAADHVSTDGFLLPNDRLAERDLLMRKGFPETYDADQFIATLQAARSGPVSVPGYSHVTYDVDHANARRFDRPDYLIFEGLGFAPFPDGRRAGDHLDALIYLHAEEADLESWFVARFLGFWRAAEHDPSSFYARFRGLSLEQADAFARQVWRDINLPNLRQHIIQAATHAHIVVRKRADHSLELMRA